jgi:hypothetical protein
MDMLGNPASGVRPPSFPIEKPNTVVFVVLELKPVKLELVNDTSLRLTWA